METVAGQPLHSGNGKEAFAFFSRLFGWTAGDAIPMGPDNVYVVFRADGEDIGGMMTMMPGTPAPHWLYYFRVDDIDAAATAIGEAGGEVRNGPMEVPGGQRVLQAVDPHGVAFGLTSPPPA